MEKTNSNNKSCQIEPILKSHPGLFEYLEKRLWEESNNGSPTKVRESFKKLIKEYINLLKDYHLLFIGYEELNKKFENDLEK